MRGQWVFCGILLVAFGADAADGEFRYRAQAGFSTYDNDFAFSDLTGGNGEAFSFESTGLDTSDVSPHLGASVGYDFGSFVLDIGYQATLAEMDLGSYTFVGAGGTEFDSVGGGDKFTDNPVSSLYSVTGSIAFPIADHFEIFARGGYASTDASLTTNPDSNDNDKIDFTLDGITYGAGGTFFITETIFVTGSYDVFDFDAVTIDSIQSQADSVDISAELGVLGLSAGLQF
jgi:opacity protein-like surface antigen